MDIDEVRKICLEHGVTFDGKLGIGKLIQELYENLAYNPNELLQLQALLVRLGRQPA